MASDFLTAADAVDDLIDDLKDEITDGVNEGMDDVQNIVRRNLRTNDSVARGVLYRRIRRQSRTLLDPTDFVSEAVTFPYWAKYVEYGNGIGSQYKAPDPMPPFAPILTWVLEKQITPRSDAIDSQYELAEAIQFAIGNQGTDAHPFVRPAWFRGKRLVTQKAADGMKYAVARNF